MCYSVTLNGALNIDTLFLEYQALGVLLLPILPESVIMSSYFFGGPAISAGSIPMPSTFPDSIAMIPSAVAFICPAG